MTKLLDKIETNTEDQNISRVPSVQEADEARQQAEAEEAKERENINVQSQLLNLLLYNRKLAEDVEKNGYYLEGYEDYKDLIQQIVNTAKEIHDADLAMPATSQQQADNFAQFDIVRLNDNIVNRNRIRTYGDECLYYSVAIIGLQVIQNIKNYFNGECENFKIHIDVLKMQNELLELQDNPIASESTYTTKQQELEPIQKELLRCINIFNISNKGGYK